MITILLSSSCPRQSTGSNVPRDHVHRGGVRDDGSGCPRPWSSVTRHFVSRHSREISSLKKQTIKLYRGELITRACPADKILYTLIDRLNIKYRRNNNIINKIISLPLSLRHQRLSLRVRGGVDDSNRYGRPWSLLQLSSSTTT
jgi:hypothetical protein